MHSKLSGSSLPLLVICGFFFAARIIISKPALSSGVQPFQLAFVGNAGAGLCLLVWIVASHQGLACGKRHLALYATLGVVSFAVPTIIAYLVVQQVGPAYTSTVYSLSPLLTMTLAATLGVEALTVKRSIGIFVGLAGILLMIKEQVSQIDIGRPFWIAAGLLIPVCAAVSNIIRSRFWTNDITVVGFSCATLMTSAAITLTISPFFESMPSWSFSPSSDMWMAFLIAASVASYLLNFRLQSLGGPVTFSQLGYWGTGFGVLLSAALFGDVLAPASMLGVLAVIAGGVLARRAVVPA